jgi:hypothetical protein
MLPRHAALLAMVLCFAAPPALGQEDLLAPLTSEPASPKSKKAKGKAKRRPAKTKGGKASALPKKTEGDLLAPLVEKTGVLVQLGGGIKGARLSVDGKDMGLVGSSVVELAPGEHTVVVRRAGYREFSQPVSLAEGHVAELFVGLEPVVGFVAVRADVPGAAVFVNGEEKGMAPLEGLMLPPGSHDIEVRLEGFLPETSRLLVRVGKEHTVNVNLRPVQEATATPVAQADEPRVPVLTPPPPDPLTSVPPEATSRPPLVKRWYFWAGVGAVATAAVVGTVVATQQPKPLSPDQVCGGPCDAVINQPAGAIRF